MIYYFYKQAYDDAGTRKIPKSRSEETPESVVDLAIRILDIKDEDEVMDLCTGLGAFIKKSIEKNKRARYFGIDSNVDLVNDLKSELTEYEAFTDIREGDVFQKEDERRYDKIFSNFPLGSNNKGKDKSKGLSDYLEKLANKNPDINKSTSADWLFISLISEYLKDGGKAIGIVSGGSVINRKDSFMRKELVERGLIEAVIAFPEKMFTPYTFIETSMVILSFGNTEGVRLIDAREICTEGRRKNILSNENIDEILGLYGEAFGENSGIDSDKSCFIGIDELKENDYVLSLSRYRKPEVKFENGHHFSEIIAHISRGIQLSADELDRSVSDEDADIRYVSISDIENGKLSEDNPTYISRAEIERNLKRYFVNEGDILLSKSGYPYRTAVIEKNDDKYILASGNLYIIRLDKAKANPYYIKAFLESETGQKLLKNISVGSIVTNIGVEQLNGLMMPVPPMEEQEAFAKRYKERQREVGELERKLKDAKNELEKKQREIQDELREMFEAR